MNILILDDYQKGIPSLESFGLLAGHSVTVLDKPIDSSKAHSTALANAEALIPLRERTQIDNALLARMPLLRCISQTGKIGRHIDTTACEARGIALLNGAGTSYATAELAFLMMMAAMRNLVPEVDAMKAGKFGIALGRTLKGRRLGIVGYGNVGKQVAKFAAAFGMKISVLGREVSVKQANADGFTGTQDREQFFSSCDAVSVHLRLTPETEKQISDADLQCMKAGSVLVNTSRAEVIDQDALFKTTQRGRPQVLAVDVYMNEPPTAATDPVLTLPNVLATPHMGYLDVDSFDFMLRSAIENLLAHSKE